jgi:hypothetical protein
MNMRDYLTLRHKLKKRGDLMQFYISLSRRKKVSKNTHFQLQRGHSFCHIKDISKVTSPVFCFIVDNATSATRQFIICFGCLIYRQTFTDGPIDFENGLVTLVHHKHVYIYIYWFPLVIEKEECMERTLLEEEEEEDKHGYNMGNTIIFLK